MLDGTPSITLDCSTNANPKVHKYEWYRDKRLLNFDFKNISKHFIHPNGSLQIFDFQQTDRGEYNCKAENTLKKVISPYVKVEIVESTKKIDFVTYASAGQSGYTLDCKASNATVKWYKVGSRLPYQRYEISMNGTLELFNLKKNDSGLYLCIINSTVAEEKLTRLIIVNSKSHSNFLSLNLKLTVGHLKNRPSKLLTFNQIGRIISSRSFCQVSHSEDP